MSKSTPIVEAQSKTPNKFSEHFTDEEGFGDSATTDALVSAEERAQKVYGRPGQKLLDMSEYGLDDPFSEGVDQYFLGQPRTFNSPPPRPGFRQRWVRFEDETGKKDLKNVTKKRGKGWIPRRRSTVTGHCPTPVVGVEGGDAIMMINGFVLCEMPEELALRIERMQEDNTLRQNMAVRANLEESARRDGTHNQEMYSHREEVKLGMRPKTVKAADNE